jgi:hypothetical protein
VTSHTIKISRFPVPYKTMAEFDSYKRTLKERLNEILTSTITEPAGAVEIFMLRGVEAAASGPSSKYSQLKRSSVPDPDSDPAPDSFLFSYKC